MSSLTPSRVEPQRPDRWSCRPDQVEIRLSTHAEDRFHERVRPALSREQAVAELEALLPFGVVTNRSPAWLEARARQSAPFYLVIGDLVLPLDLPAWGRAEMVAVTLIPRGSLSQAARADRNEQRRRRALIRHAARGHRAPSRKPHRIRTG